jgi:S-adenosylmethionine hydrolase
LRSAMKILIGTAIVALLALPLAAQQQLKVIGFMTDFDVKDDAVGICKAVMDGVAPGVRVIDITHQSEPYNIAMGARFLAGSAPYFPKDAVFVVVIDPGVGSTRKAIIAKSRVGQFFVLPDNGLLTLVHVAKLVRLDLKNASIDAAGLHGLVIGTDGPFGNLVLNVPAETFAQLGYKLGDLVPVTLGGKSYVFPLVKTFSDVPIGKELFYIDSRGRLSIGIDQGNFAETYKIGEGAELSIPKR